jgi:hypothetical protein
MRNSTAGFTPTVKFRIIASAAIKRFASVLFNGVSEMKNTFFSKKAAMRNSTAGFTPTVKFRIIASAAIKRFASVLFNGVSEMKNTFFSKKAAMRNSTAGFTLIEIILATSIITTFLVSISMYYKKILDVSHDTTRHIQSGFLLEEGVEVVKLLRDTSWSTKIATLSTTTTYYLYWSSGTWTSTTTKQVVENVFTRSFTVADVTRDVSDNIASSGTFDPASKKVMFTVTWPRKGSRATTTESAETYIMNLFNN